MPTKADKPKNQPGATRKRSRKQWRKWLLLICALGLLAVLAVCLVYGFWASSFDIRGVQEMAERSTVYDMDVKVYSRLQGENRITVPRSEVSEHFVQALLAREDARFYSHRGVDPIGIARAIVRNVTSGSAREGASTLTQQLARNSYPLGGKTIHRKLLEAFVALRIEQHYSKEQILEHYMNRIYFGAGVYGIETASQAYFGKRAADLKLGEAALIAGIIRGPGKFSPTKNMKGALRERDTVLERLVKREKITPSQAEGAKHSPIVLTRRKTISSQENYAMDWVRRELDELLTDEQRSDGGLKIYTTIDPVMQRTAQTAVDAQLRKVEARPGYAHPKRADFSEEAKAAEEQTPYLQGAVVLIDNRSGGIRALVGGRDFSESKYNRAILPEAARQIGSTFKPFVYAAAYRRGLLPGAAINDGRIGSGEVRQAANWSPENSDGTYKGVLRAEEGLVLSRNTMTVRVGELAGFEAIGRLSKDAGLADMPTQPAVYLGAFEATLAELTASYTVFANSGIRRQTYIIERIDDASGEMIYRAAHIQRQVLEPAVNWLVHSGLARVVERGTAAAGVKAMGFNRPAAGKTGTTNDFKDAWFVGYTSALTCGVWVGLDQPETIVTRGYGSALALPIWAEVMNAASPERYPSAAFRPPESLVRAVVCSVSNELATTGCERSGSAYAADLPGSLVPVEGCEVHRGGAIADATRRNRDEAPRRTVPQSIFRSFRKFFGGD